MANAIKTAWCLGGGGSRCIVQFGMIKRLWEAGMRPDVVFATSGGALNGAGIAMGDMEKMEWVWLNVRNRNVRRLAPWLLFGPQAALYDFSPLGKSIRELIVPQLLLKSPVALWVTCTSLQGNCAVRYRLTGVGAHPDPSTILQASCSPPVLVPPVSGALYDGGISDNYNVGAALAEGAQHIYMMQPTIPGRWQIRSVLDALDVLITIPIWSNYCRELEGLACMPEEQRPRLTVIQPATAVQLNLFDFDMKNHDRQQLIKTGYDLAAKAIG